MKRFITLAVTLLIGSLALCIPAEAATRENITLTTPAGLRFTMAVVKPEIWTPESSLPVIFALPPGNGDMNMVNAFLRNYWLEEGDRRGYIIVSPTVVGRNLETTARDVLDTVFEWMDNNVSHDRQRMALVGQSNGGLGAFHVARVRPDWFTAMVVMPGGFGGQGSLDMLAGKPILLAVGEQDTSWVQLTHTTRDMLRLAGAEPRVDIVPGAGHVFSYSPAQLFDWIEQSFPE